MTASPPNKIRKTDSEWRAQLTPEQYRITRQAGTERPGTGPYLNEKRDGTYRCVSCGTPLFRSETKYESGSGWPSFTAPVDAAMVEELADHSHGMTRTEVRCAACEAHLGHVFNDGPGPNGLRYCMNGCALDMDPDDDKT
ncbi:peptide-methionine (R)-S-oxide reductase MsrB [Bauldia sp.]|uniref:peptide-methionine (R)-S-oxide reductase MsrB n=1 Tax=Bauldia sp. TaxID=2575872 RepID=UPI003BA9DD05